MTKREQLEALRAAQKELMALYEGLKDSGEQAGSHRVAILAVIREKIGPVVADLTNEAEQEEFDEE